VKYSQRLEIMAQEVFPKDRVIDVGSDHGYLPLLLWEKFPGSRVVVSDISPGSLNKAKENIGARLTFEQEQEWVSYRLGSGLSVVSPGEVNVAVIGGMGGVLITEILEKSLEMAKEMDRFILQPRNGQGKLRYWLSQNGFQIQREHLAKEGKFICEILIVVPTWECSNPVEWSSGNEIQFEVPEHLLEVQEKEWVEPFLRGKLEIENGIRMALGTGESPDLAKAVETDNRILYLEGLIQRWEEQHGRMETGVAGNIK